MDCQEYLKENFEQKFPKISLTIIYNKEEYKTLLQTIDGILGPKPYTKAICVSKKGFSWIYIDFLSHFGIKNPIENLIGNLSISFIEELIHSANLGKSETEVHELVCSAIEGFFEMKLTADIKAERMSFAQKFDAIDDVFKAKI